MEKELVIKLKGGALKKYIDYVSYKTTAEVDEDCEPSGVTVCVDIGGIFNSAYIKLDNNKIIDLGDVEVKLK